MTQHTTPRTTPPPARPAERGLTGTLGVPQIVFMVVAMAAPLTVVAGLIPIMIATGKAPACRSTSSSSASSCCSSRSGSPP